MIETICCDSMTYLPILAERLTPCFDMIWLDPPYFDWADGDIGTKKPDHRDLSFYTYQLLNPKGVVFLCGNQPQLMGDWQWWDRWFRLVFEVIQYKHGGTPPVNKFQPVRTHENIWCMIRRGVQITETKLNMDRAARNPSTKKTVHKEPKSAMRIRFGGETMTEWRSEVGLPKSVIDCSQIKAGNVEYEGHPTQKPIALMRVLIRMSTEPGNWILDPFAGSGTTGLIAEEEARNCLMMEINKDYIKMIRRRLTRNQKMMKLMNYL